MANIKLQASYRASLSKGHTKELRRNGYATGSVYGQGGETVPVEINLPDFVEKIKGSEAGLKSLIDIKIAGAPDGSDGIVIVKKFIKNPLTRRVEDIQFLRVLMSEKITVGVPIELIGEAAGIKTGGILEQSLDELQISTLPGNIPSRFEVDISQLGAGEHITVAELTIPEGVEVLSDPTANVCAVVAHHMKLTAEEAEAEQGAAEEAPEAE
jgi:large subunit ribosomal protein L25